MLDITKVFYFKSSKFLFQSGFKRYHPWKGLDLNTKQDGGKKLADRDLSTTKIVFLKFFIPY
jgi:hypothetical protein